MPEQKDLLFVGLVLRGMILELNRIMGRPIVILGIKLFLEFMGRAVFIMTVDTGGQRLDNKTGMDNLFF